ncbi:hypothetical protein EV195_104109 [Tenacibaculum skagerrakense]|uniref:Uncharacterized protein n=1 Tax=Tenacibaculum skagerrakense TaxID=186571 RepID=A0A4R2NUB8_9FLAO|nr:hypothetical protein [Tenacibaculum skagerrakense]TCP25078.1 hypothetical protein EV195_104109 [Tenacibaculum skagerrakense]
MGFGGSVSAMISSLKNNKRERKSAFEKMKKHASSSIQSDSLVFKNKASEEDLAEIKRKIRLENRKGLLLNSIGLTVVALLIVYVLTTL